MAYKRKYVKKTYRRRNYRRRNVKKQDEGIISRAVRYGKTAWNVYNRVRRVVPWLPLVDMTKGSAGAVPMIGPSGKAMLLTQASTPHSAPKYSMMGAPTVSIANRARSVLPPRLKTKMIYAQTLDITTAPPASFIHLWNINSLFQPSASGGFTPHQPMGFDQLSSFYRSHIVTGCKIVIEGANTSGPAAQLSLGAYDINVTPPTTISALNESPFFITNTVTNQHRWKFEKYFDTAAVAGLTKDAYMDEQQMWGSSTANPTFLIRGHLELNNLDLTQFVGECTATLIFYSIFFNPLQLAQS